MNQTIALVTFFFFKEQGIEKLRQFQNAAAPLFAKHQLTIAKEFVPSGQGQIGSAPNVRERPDLVQIALFPSLENLQAYLADPDVAALAPLRASGLRRMTASFGPTIALGDGLLPEPKGTVHFVALATFSKPDGFDDLVAFNRKGIETGLFSKYGLRVAHLAKAAKTVTPIGTDDGPAPQALIHFTVTDPARMKEYLADPAYLQLAPLGDGALSSYDFFRGI